MPAGMPYSRWSGSHFCRVDADLPPPRGFVAGAVRGAVVVTAQRPGELGALRLARGDERARRGSAGADEQRRLDFEAARRVRSRGETPATSNCTADLVDEAKFHAEVAALRSSRRPLGGTSGWRFLRRRKEQVPHRSGRADYRSSRRPLGGTSGRWLSSEAEGAGRLARGNGRGDVAPSPCSAPSCHALPHSRGLGCRGAGPSPLACLPDFARWAFTEAYALAAPGHFMPAAQSRQSSNTRSIFIAVGPIANSIDTFGCHVSPAFEMIFCDCSPPTGK